MQKTKTDTNGRLRFDDKVGLRRMEQNESDCDEHDDDDDDDEDAFNFDEYKYDGEYDAEEEDSVQFV